jgi:hypothetical protein
MMRNKGCQTPASLPAALRTRLNPLFYRVGAVQAAMRRWKERGHA